MPRPLPAGNDAWALTLAPRMSGVPWKRMPVKMALLAVETSTPSSARAARVSGMRPSPQGLVNGRTHAVGNLDGESTEGRGDGTGEAGWTCSGDEEIGLSWGRAQVHEKDVLCKV